MNRNPEGSKLLVATGDRSFGSSVADAVETAAESVSAECIDPETALAPEQNGVDAAVVDSRARRSAAIVEEFADRRNLPVAVLTDQTGCDDTVTSAIEAGATDVFPRTTTPAQYELLVERVTGESSGVGGTAREHSYRELFENSSDGLVVSDPETGEILEVNERFCEMTGHDRAELVGDPVRSVTAGGTDARERRQAAIQRAREGGTQLFERRNQHSDGHTYPVEVHLTLIEVHGRERVLASVRDVTERKRREREYEQIFNKVSDAIAVFDPENGEILDVNDSYHEMLGYEDLEAIQKLGIEGLSVAEEGYTSQRGTELVREVSETGEGQTVEWLAETRDGEHIWLDVTVAPAEIGGEDRVLTIQRDITERRELERTYRQIFEGASDGLVVHEPETGEVVDVNERYCEVTGYDREELLDGTLGLVVPDDANWTREDAVEWIRRAREEGPQLFELEAERKTGETFVGEVHLRSIELRGTKRVLASVRDITERKRREREYEQIFNKVSDAISVFEPESGEFVDINDSYREMFGYGDLETVRELGIEGLSATEEGYTGNRAEEIIAEVSETGEGATVEWLGERRDGERIWVDATLTPAEVGGRERVLSIQRDITERKRRERAIETLERATERLQTATEREEVATVAVEAASEILDLPMAICWFHDEDTGRLEDAVATDPVREADLVSGLDPGRYEYDVFRDGTVTEYSPSDEAAHNPLETGVLLPLGGHGLVAAGAGEETEADSAVLDVAKALADHVATALDRVERERAVRESERRFRMIAERIDEIIYLAEPDFSEVLYVNPAYEDIWGQSVETLEADATAFRDAIDERDRPAFEADFEEMLADIEAGDPDESYEFEFRVRQPSGEVRWVNPTGYTVELPGGRRRFVGIADDITERKRREQRLEVFNRILRHNLRNKIDVIRSHAEVLSDQTTDSHPERIIAAVDELAALGARARETDRIMSMGDTLAETTLSEKLHETVETMTSERDDLTVTTDIPDGVCLQTNEQAVTTAVESALENALDHAESAVQVTLEDCPDGYTITITDDGPGIPEDELVPIEAGTETDFRHGRGLGLWQLRWSVDKLNGELSFDTRAGTEVQIRVPDRHGAE